MAESAILWYEDKGINICTDSELMVYSIWMSEDPSKLHFFYDRLNDSVGALEMRFAPPKC